MTKKKAEMILNALNNNEFQYIQQLKRKPSKLIISHNKFLDQIDTLNIP